MGALTVFLADDLDDAFAQYEAMMAQYDAAIADLDREDAAGRTGLAAYRKAVALHEDIKQCAIMLAGRIDEARRSL